VSLDRGLADEQALGDDDLVRTSGGHMLEHFKFSSGQRVVHLVLCAHDAICLFECAVAAFESNHERARRCLAQGLIDFQRSRNSSVDVR
jgi:hypothetical protein